RPLSRPRPAVGRLAAARGEPAGPRGFPVRRRPEPRGLRRQAAAARGGARSRRRARAGLVRGRARRDAARRARGRRLPRAARAPLRAAASAAPASAPRAAVPGGLYPPAADQAMLLAPLAAAAVPLSGARRARLGVAILALNLLFAPRYGAYEPARWLVAGYWS